MNKRWHVETLVASQPGNLNAVKHGVHSARLMAARAAEIEAELADQCQLSATERLTVSEVARYMAVLEAIDGALGDQGVVDRRGKATYLLEERARASRQLGYWLSRLDQALREQQGSKIRAGFSEYRNELQRIALGYDASASPRDRLAALDVLLKLGSRGATDGPEPTPASPETGRRLERIEQAQEERALEILEGAYGLRPIIDIPP